jgi:hypothetical protein
VTKARAKTTRIRTATKARADITWKARSPRLAAWLDRRFPHSGTPAYDAYWKLSHLTWVLEDAHERKASATRVATLEARVVEAEKALWGLRGEKDQWRPNWFKDVTA